MADGDPLEQIVTRLEAIAADLDDYAFERLRAAMADGQRSRPEWDKPVTQARRAVEKAIHLLRRVDPA
jgi:hypothetical protein